MSMDYLEGDIDQILSRMETLMGDIASGMGQIEVSDLRRLDHYEATTVRAIAFWISLQTGIDISAIHSMLKDRYDVLNIESLYAGDYSSAVAFLIGLGFENKPIKYSC